MQRIIALVGPTAVGKTDVSIELAKRLDAEIIGCDSMQVYRHMRRLTTQPTAEQRAAVPHHLFDCVEPTESFNAAQYRRLALEAIRIVQRRGKSVLLVVGTGLYLKVLRQGLCSAPAEQPAIRQRLAEAIQEQGSDAFHDRLRSIDPVAAAKIHPRDSRRIVRALEVFEASGRPLSSFWQQEQSAQLPMLVIGLTRERIELYERINRRVERMIRDEAVLDEVRQLQGIELSRSARQVHGLRFIQEYGQGRLTLAEAVLQWQQQVRNYAKRQLTWFRADPHIQWVTVAAHDAVKQTVEAVLQGLKAAPERHC